jgi:hypothetical protein
MTNSGTVTNTAVETRLFSQVVTAPASGSAANVVVSDSAQLDGLIVTCISYTGVDQTTPLGTAATDTSSPASISLTVGANGMAMSAAGNADTSTCGSGLTSGQTRQSDLCNGGLNLEAATSTTISTGSVTMTWTYGNPIYNNAIAIPINAAAVTGVARRRIIIQ